MAKRKVCVIITSNIHYARSKLLLAEIRNHPNLELQIIVGASAILPNYGDVIPLLQKDGFHHNAKITMTLEGGNTAAMAKTAGIGIMEFATAFENLQPDIVLVRADRYEVLSAAVAAAYLNIPVAHVEGGDVSGTIDESVRHAITKLAHIHFPTNEQARQRILRMGEHPDYVFMVGSPEIEFVAQHDLDVTNEYINYWGVGDAIDITKPYMMVMQHPVTSEVGSNRKHVEETLSAINELGIPTIWFWPNVDAGTDEVSKAIRVFREKEEAKHIRFIKYLPPEQFIGLLKKTACLIGNSSAGIKECSYLGVPVVNIGTRQHGRSRSANVMDVGYTALEITEAIKRQLAHGPYPKDERFYQEKTSKKIADIMATVQLYTQKYFVD